MTEPREITMTAPEALAFERANVALEQAHARYAYAQRAANETLGQILKAHDVKSDGSWWNVEERPGVVLLVERVPEREEPDGEADS